MLRARARRSVSGDAIVNDVSDETPLAIAVWTMRPADDASQDLAKPIRHARLIALLCKATLLCVDAERREQPAAIGATQPRSAPHPPAVVLHDAMNPIRFSLEQSFASS